MNHACKWRETEISCDMCGTHPAVICEDCDITLDLIFNDDPREKIVQGEVLEKGECAPLPGNKETPVPSPEAGGNSASRSQG
jgi:hypothetical protein